MAVVQAKTDLYAANGKLMVAEAGRKGTAIRKKTVCASYFNKVAVRWEGRRKIYWHFIDDLEFLEHELAKEAYVALPPGHILDMPALPPPPEYEAYHFGENLQQLRLNCNMSQRELTEALLELGHHTAQTTISFWERRDTAPSGKYVRLLAKAMGIPVFLFFVNFQDCEWLRRVREYINTLADMYCEEGVV